MEADSSYKLTEFSNINGRSFLMHLTKSDDFCHVKITLRKTYWAWICKNFMLYSNKIVMFLLLGLAGLVKLFNYQIGKLDIFATVVVSLVFLFMHYYYVTEEEIICIKKVGIQMSTVYFTGRTLQEFIPQNYIADCVINEVIYSQRIIFVLTILISKTEDVSNYSANRYAKIEKAMTLFKGTKPRLKTLQVMQKEIRQVVFYEKDGNRE